tara:strand:+ start:145 stop:492 length:348 start_codon:yes stop_codon:yes gene_type:complete
MSKPIFSPWLEDIISEAENKQIMTNEINIPTELFASMLVKERDRHLTAKEKVKSDTAQTIIIELKNLEPLQDELQKQIDRKADYYVSVDVRKKIHNSTKLINELTSDYLKLTKDV